MRRDWRLETHPESPPLRSTPTSFEGTGVSVVALPAYADEYEPQSDRRQSCNLPHRMKRYKQKLYGTRRLLVLQSTTELLASLCARYLRVPTTPISCGVRTRANFLVSGPMRT
jgi:hypothetical protein